jgi:hypothetical protein
MEQEETQLEQVKADVYETWAVINRAFEQIITALNKLEKTGVLKWDYMHNQSVITNYLWAKLNTRIMAEVGRREEDDRSHYGKMRAEIERRIRGRK